MFNLSRRSQSRYPTIRQALVQAGLASAADPARVTVLEAHGLFSGRHVNFFRAFEPGRQDAVLGSGHVEQGGLVVVESRSQAEGPVPVRQPANRAAHLDDERLVFWDPEISRSAEAMLSAPAASWLHARANPTAGMRS
jgi:hypothetical protein